MTKRSIRFGVTLPQIKRSWEEASRAAKAFDQLGFDHVWVCDHVYGVPAPQIPILEAWSQLAAVAAITERVELGTLVTPPFLRNPAMLAKQIATIDQIAGGRVIAGLGSGWVEAEFVGTGNRFPSLPERQDALEEQVQIMRMLWEQESSDFDGKHFRLEAAACEPKPARRVPILIGGSGEKRLLPMAARYADIWNNPAGTQAELGQKVEALCKSCDAVGRAFEEVEVSQQCTVVIALESATAEAALGKASKIYGDHMGKTIAEHGIWGDPDQGVGHIQRHIELGCTSFVSEVFGRDTVEPAQLFAESVMPEVR